MSSIVLHLPNVSFSKRSKSFSQQIDVKPVVIDFGRLLKSSNKNHDEVVPGIANTDLLHATASLYGVSLSEVTDDIIYPTLCEKWSKTILIVLDESQAREKLKHRLMTSSKQIEEGSMTKLRHSFRTLQEKQEQVKQAEENDRFVDIFSDEETDDGEDSGGEEEDHMAGLGDFLRAVDERREETKRWSETRGSDQMSDQLLPLGVENRLIGCATFERSYERPGEKIIQLTLVAVRGKYRELGIGSYLIKQLLDPSITGGSDVIVVNADHNATEFFERHGFTDDVILNSRYAHIGDVWFNSKRMCYLNGFSHPVGGRSTDPYFSLREMELEISMWKERSVQAYQQFASIVYRMRREILTLHARASLQEETIARLQRGEWSVDEEQAELKRRIGDLREAIDALKEGDAPESRVTSSSAHDVTSTSSKTLDSEQLNDDDVVEGTEGVDDLMLLAEFAGGDSGPSVGGIKPCNGCAVPAAARFVALHNLSDAPEVEQFCDVTPLLQEEERTENDVTPEDGAPALSESLTTPLTGEDPHPLGSLKPPPYVPQTSPSRSVLSTGSPPTWRPTDSTWKEDVDSLLLHEIKHCFLSSFSERNDDVIDVRDITAASLPLDVVTRFEDTVTSSHDPDMVASLYYCDATERCGDASLFKRVMKRGFQACDFVEGDYGKGLHFSRHARCAAHFSPSGYVIVAKVCLGRTQTVTSKDPDRQHPPEGYDSILTQGRLSSQVRHGVTTHSEYVVFQPHQAVPVALVEFSFQY